MHFQFFKKEILFPILCLSLICSASCTQLELSLEAPTDYCQKDDECAVGLFCKLGNCVPPETEICDGLDNDFDRKVDENFPENCLDLLDQCPRLSIEICDDEDNDCDGIIDEGKKNACGHCGATPQERCNGKDEDCDGNADEDFDIGQACQLSDQNNCLNGKWACNPNGTGAYCRNINADGLDTCDGIDSDCDGRTDENFKPTLKSCIPEGQTQSNKCQDQAPSVCQDGQEINGCDLLADQSEELCDGLDNDCDDRIDETLTKDLDTAVIPGCGIGACFRPSQEKCTEINNGTTRTFELVNVCEPLAIQSAEICDGVDNDCDGITDEHTGYFSLSEMQSGLFENVPTCQENQAGIAFCQNGIFNAECVDSKPETCDAIDNDLDGATDEGLVVPILCGGFLPNFNTVKGWAVCEKEMMDRQWRGKWTYLCPTISHPIEQLDGLDNDGDGFIRELDQDPIPDGLIDDAFINDQAIPRCAIRPCQQTEVNGQPPSAAQIGFREQCVINLSAVHPDLSQKLEVINQFDDDCDGQIDENLTTTLDHCGVNDEICTFNNAVSRCEPDDQNPQGVCTFVECMPGYRDQNTDLSDGCELAVFDQPDSLGIDSNQDGIDGDLEFAVFVLAENSNITLRPDASQFPLGSAQNPFTKLSGVRNALHTIINQTINQPHLPHRPILLQKGIHLLDSENLEQAKVRIEIHGGYDVAVDTDGRLKWSREAFNLEGAENIINAQMSKLVGNRNTPIFAVNNQNPSQSLHLDRVHLQLPAADESQPSPTAIKLISCREATLRDVLIEVPNALDGTDGNNGLEAQNASAAEINGKSGNFMPPYIGNGGSNPICCANGECSGGDGGNPMPIPMDGTSTSGKQGKPISNRSFGGSQAYRDSETQTGFVFATNGDPGINGNHGRNANQDPNALGKFSATNQTMFWQAATPNNLAEVGGYGSGGSGGGAGFMIQENDVYGGNGGGAGGCGGKAATSGTSGQSAIGMVWHDTCPLILRGWNRFKVGNGGNGGHGGNGGNGIAGGNGGGNQPNSETEGGRGGDGGNGGCGGNGVGGHGGHSIGLLSLSPNVPFGLDYQLSLGGALGRGGFNENCADSQRASDGEIGKSIQRLCCLPTAVYACQLCD